MSVEQNVTATRRLIDECFSAANLGIVADLVAPDSVEHQRGLRPGPEGTRETIRTLHLWFSDFRLTIVDVSATDDMVWIRNRATGINTGSVFGRPPTGKAIDITVIDILRFTDGRIVEHWGVPDQLGMLMQLGLFGRAEPADEVAHEPTATSAA